MSKLDELIKKLCPDGVEYKAIKDCVLKIRNIKWKNADESETYSYIDLTSVNRNKSGIDKTISINRKNAPSRAQQIVKKQDILLGTTRPMLKRFCIVPAIYDNQICSTGFCVLRANPEMVLPQYLYHHITSSKFFNYVEKNQKGASYPSISDDRVKAFRIPVPPMEVQREIVKILDNFTELTAELTAGLTAELTARKKQYEYYRNRLLTFDKENITYKKLKETCWLKSGKAISSNDISSEKSAEYPFACYGGNGIRGYVSQFIYDLDCPIIGRQGALCGNVQYALGKFYPTEHAVVVRSKGEYDQRFLYYLLTYMNLNQYKSAGAQPGLSVKNLENLKAPVPPIMIQKRLVNVLDNFDKVCNDLHIGLSAEIEARKKQYEFYRDSLLTFLEKGGSILTDRQTDRQTELKYALIKLLQYVFGYVIFPISTVGKVLMCKRIFKEQTMPIGDVPFYKIGTFGGQADAYINENLYHEYKNKYSFPLKGEILISCSGTIGRCIIYDGEPAYFQDSNIVWVSNDESIVLNKFLYYLYKTMSWNIVSGGTIGRLYKSDIEKTLIKVPPKDKQVKIVSILERFDTLCHDISSGLPAEIKARKKQYEYYRDKLLSFKEKKG